MHIWQLLTGLSIGIGCIALGLLAERRWPARPKGATETALNVRYFTAASALQALLTPVLAGLTALAVNRFGGGAIVLPSHGWGVAVSVVCYLLVMDVGEYLFHRAQHWSPFLWSMHSLHHSDTSLGVSTTIRHFWPEHLLKTITIYFWVGLIFKVGPEVIAAYGLMTLYNYFVHSNVRVGFGRWSWVANSPQYHRIHHSVHLEHADCNFAALFPALDVIFGSYRRPRAGEYPASGLSSGDGPATLLDALVWPIQPLRGGRLTGKLL